jgi:hypothetical protein
MADRLDWLSEGGKPVIMGDHAPPPLPDARLGIQLGRVGRLRLAPEPAPALWTIASTAGRQEVPHHFRGPPARVITPLSGTAADCRLDLRPLLHRESGGAPRDRRTLQPVAPRLLKCMNPGTHGRLIPLQPLRDLGTALSIQQQHNAVRARAQPRIVCPATGGPYLASWDGSVRDL